MNHKQQKALAASIAVNYPVTTDYVERLISHYSKYSSDIGKVQRVVEAHIKLTL